MLHCKYTIGPNVTHSGTLRQCDKLSHMPAWHGFLSKFCQFVSLWRSDAVVCNAFSYHQKWCRILEENVLLYFCTLGSIAFFVTPCHHCYSIHPNIMTSSSIYFISLYKVFIIWMPIISKSKYILGSRKSVQNASGGQLLSKSHLSQIHEKELLTQAPF